tara:strand:- start:28659 stop:29414 length:756 start_codon:yes stop_codon:yes gene_type:complete
MVRLNIDKALLKGFLTGFGPGVGDLRAEAKAGRLEGIVALPTHLLRTQMPADVEDAGEVVFSDIPKVLSFLKALPKSANIINIWQPKGRPLKMSCGMTSVEMPASDYIRSYVNVPRALLLVDEAENDLWKSWAGQPLTSHMLLKTQWLGEVSDMQKVVGKDMTYSTIFDPQQAQFSVSAGRAGGVKMKVGNELETFDGPEASSIFGPWFPTLMQCIPTGVVDVFTADDYILVLRHVEKEHLLIILDQQGGN